MLAFGTPAQLGNYDLVRAIGSGGMGVVYEARHRLLGRRVAIKTLHARATASRAGDVLAARFFREGQAAAQVEHAHVVDVFDFGVEGGTPFLVMELVEGETLAQRLERERPLPLATAVEWMLPVLSAVAELHAAGIIHRDLKPANILLDTAATGEICPKVTDFGVSQIEGGPAITDSGAVLGTCAYMPPEQARASRAVTERSDQYALGVILYECVTGRLPFEGATPYELTHAALHESPVPPRARNPALPEIFERAVLRALSRDPADRFSCVEELAAALLPFAEPRVAARWTSEFAPAPTSEARAWIPPTTATFRASGTGRARSLGAFLGTLSAAGVLLASSVVAMRWPGSAHSVRSEVPAARAPSSPASVPAPIALPSAPVASVADEPAPASRVITPPSPSTPHAAAPPTQRRSPARQHPGAGTVESAHFQSVPSDSGTTRPVLDPSVDNGAPVIDP